MNFALRTLSPKESRIVLGMVEHGQKAIRRQEVIGLLDAEPQAADRVIRSLRRKGWLERASWGKYLLIPPEQGPDALGESNVLALASRIVDAYYLGYATAAEYYGLTSQHRRVIWLVTPMHVRDREILDSKVRAVNPSPCKFFGFSPVNVLNHSVMMSDREKTAIDCIDRPRLAGGEGEAATILARACRRMDWRKAAGYLERMRSKALVRRFGWLADHAGAEIPEAVRLRLRELAAGGGRSFWGPRSPRHGAIGYQGDWRLAVNVGVEDLRESSGLARKRTL